MKTKRKEIIDEPLNRVLVLDKNSGIIDSTGWWRLLLRMNLVVLVDYSKSTFSILKNRWGLQGSKSKIPMSLLSTFLFHPQITTRKELEEEKWVNSK